VSGIDLETAKQIIRSGFEFGHASGFQPLTFVVLDAGGHVVAAEREDGSSNKRFEIAQAKAHGAISLGLGSRALMERAEKQAYFITGAAIAIGGAGLVAGPGGVLVRNAAGELIGVVGVSGDTSDNDESAAVAGIEASGLTAQVA
jgi:uncharacterized protein GlcG (DUF336 family)